MFWCKIVPLILDIAKMVGCEYLYVFAADRSDDLDASKLITYYKQSLCFRGLDSEGVEALKPGYDENCKGLIQPVRYLPEMEKDIWEMFLTMQSKIRQRHRLYRNIILRPEQKATRFVLSPLLTSISIRNVRDREGRSLMNPRSVFYMHHKLDIHPIPTDVLYVNELSLAGKVPYETRDTMDKVLTGRTKSNGGILPDDNVRIYVPMDLNADIIMWQLYSLHGTLGYPTEKNESAYCSGVGKVISQLEIYDQVWAVRNLEDTVQKEDGGVRHSHQGIELAKQIVKYLEDIEGTAECFPYDEIQELREAFWL